MTLICELCYKNKANSFSFLKHLGWKCACDCSFDIEDYSISHDMFFSNPNHWIMQINNKQDYIIKGFIGCVNVFIEQNNNLNAKQKEINELLSIS